jgi:phosphatidate phosphatase PAH1
MYLSQQASLKYAENEAGLIEIRKREIERQAQEAQQRRELDQKTTDTLGKLITQQAEQQAKQSEQQLAFTERFATIIEKIIPKRSAFEVYDDNKKRIQCMLERGDIDPEEASVLLGNIKRELLTG